MQELNQNTTGYGRDKMRCIYCPPGDLKFCADWSDLHKSKICAQTQLSWQLTNRAVEC